MLLDGSTSTVSLELPSGAVMIYLCVYKVEGCDHIALQRKGQPQPAQQGLHQVAIMVKKEVKNTSGFLFYPSSKCVN